MPPFFSICIPQYNRTSFLIKALERLSEQSFRDFEICIADDLSPDGRQQEVIDFLRSAGLNFKFEINPTNLRYDGNLRAAIALSSGRYCVLMGNDDGLSHPDVLKEFHAVLSVRPQCGVLISNYREESGTIVSRIRFEADYQGNPWIAASVWRDFSFVSGIVFIGEQARGLATNRFDGTEYYQLYLGSRIISTGFQYCVRTFASVDKDLQVAGEDVDSYRMRPKKQVRAFSYFPSTLAHLIRLVSEGMENVGTESERRRARLHALWQFYCFTMPFWLIEYRRIQSWSYSSALGISLRPKINAPFALGVPGRLLANIIWSTVYVCALVVPISVFFAFKPMLHRIAKFMRPRNATKLST